jgi:hypothetical protein
MLRNISSATEKGTVGQTLYSTLPALASLKIDLTLLHIPAVGSSLAGSWREGGRFPSR